jgi:transcriptional regulator with PAS, ATPase and Fis domain
MVGASEKMRRVFELISKVAASNSTVLILGESGTGKELVARSIHNLSLRRNFPFVPVNCGAIPEELLESELFGHEKGSFTGAFKMRTGRFEIAKGGSIFLDEVSEMSPSLQVKLLRVIQEKEFERVGSAQSIKADVRIIAATNRNIDEEVQAGRFREDLYYRLNVIPVKLPALRERPEDIPLLIRHFLEKSTSVNTSPLKTLSKNAMQRLIAYRWPGNVRELENLMERLSVLCESDTADIADLPERITFADAAHNQNITGCILGDEGTDLSKTVGEFEKNLILQALNKTGWVKNRAAKLLKLNRTTLVEKIKKLNIEN